MYQFGKCTNLGDFHLNKLALKMLCVFNEKTQPTGMAFLRKYLIGQPCIPCDCLEYILFLKIQFLMEMQDCVSYWRKLLQFRFHPHLCPACPPFTYINAFVMLLIVHFYYTIWTLKLLAPICLCFVFVFCFFIEGEVIFV